MKKRVAHIQHPEDWIRGGSLGFGIFPCLGTLETISLATKWNARLYDRLAEWELSPLLKEHYCTGSNKRFTGRARRTQLWSSWLALSWKWERELQVLHNKLFFYLIQWLYWLRRKHDKNHHSSGHIISTCLWEKIC